MSMAPASPTIATVIVVLAFAVRPACSQLFTPPPAPPQGYTFAPPADAGGGRVSASLSLTTTLLFVALIFALFLLGFFSEYLRRCAGGGGNRGGAAAFTANAAVAASAAAAFASAAGARRRPAAAGLDPAAMDALPTLTYATARAVKAGGALECAVCLSEFGGDDDGEKLRLLPGCCHVFHAACVDVWLAAHVTCPVCRADLSDPAVADAGRVLAADLAAAHQQADHDTVVNVVVETWSEPAPGPGNHHQDLTSSSGTAEERVDRYTLRLPERLKREIEKARRHRRAVSSSSVTAASSGRWTAETTAHRTMSAARLSRRWSGLFRVLQRSTEPPDGHHRGRVAPLRTDDDTAAGGDDDGDGGVEVVVARGDDEEKCCFAHSLTFAGFVIDGDVAARDWTPEVFQISKAVPAGSPSRQ